MAEKDKSLSDERIPKRPYAVSYSYPEEKVKKAVKRLIKIDENKPISYDDIVKIFGEKLI